VNEILRSFLPPLQESPSLSSQSVLSLSSPLYSLLSYSPFHGFNYFFKFSIFLINLSHTQLLFYSRKGADLYVEKKGEKAILELKAVSPIIKETKPKEKEEIKEYIQLQKYLSALGEEKGFLINFPFPPKEEPEMIVTFE